MLVSGIPKRERKQSSEASLDGNGKHEQMQKRSGKMEVKKGGRGAKSGGGGLKD